MTGKTERRRHRRFRLLFIDVSDFVRRFILRRQAAMLVAGPRPAAHPAPSATPAHPARPAHQGSGWDSSLATGIERIDRQHQVLMASIRDFQQAVQEGSGHEALAGMVSQMSRYAEDHFTLEEAYLAHLKYPHLPAHREEHARLRARVLYLQQRLAGGGPAKVQELAAQLCKYFRDHILKEDAAYVEFARSSGGNS
jgi:hemerythrin-like metal-binding protein